VASALIYFFPVKESVAVLPISGATYLIYVFDGQLVVNENMDLKKGESLVVENEENPLKGVEDCNIVLFLTDLNATAFKEGMYSDNINRTK
jgi:hypothetical protein